MAHLAAGLAAAWVSDSFSPASAMQLLYRSTGRAPALPQAADPNSTAVLDCRLDCRHSASQRATGFPTHLDLGQGVSGLATLRW